MFLLSVCALVALGAQLSLAQGEPSYLISAPNRWIPDRPETVCVNLYNVNSATQVTISLESVWINYRWRELPAGVVNETLTTTSIVMQASEKSKCTTLTVPEFTTEDRPEYLIVRASGRPAVGRVGFTFEDTMKVNVLGRWYETDITFIQTDKPIYKPGQLVRIRVLTLDTALKPAYDMIEEVSIETPSRVRVEQWNNITVTKGMVQLDFQLHSEPEQGNYIIKMRRDGKDSQESFEVKEYVLPKFEVTVEPPKFITFQSPRVIAKVCAKYTFGQPVRGNVEASVCVRERRQFYWWRPAPVLDGAPGAPGAPGTDPSEPNSYCTLINEPLVDGCYTIDVTRRDVGYDRYTEFQWGTSLDIEARVLEQGTNVYLNATKQTLTFQEYDIRLEMEGAEKFKPGLPYNAKVIAKRLDGVAVPNEPIEISISNWRAGGKYTKNYMTDINGEVKFSIPPAAQDLASYSVTARATAYNASFWSWNSPSASRYVEGWYSPSGSFLQLTPTEQTLRCNTQKTFRIQYTTSVALNTDLHYQVVGLTDIVESGSSPISLNLNLAITEPDAADDWDLTPRDRCWYYWGPCPYLLEPGPPGSPAPTTTTPRPEGPRSVIATHKGTVSVTVPITPAMSTTGRLVVFYIKPDGEVVADGIDFKVEECTANDASMTFSEATVRPGEAVNIQFSASPQSLCSYGVVDKSVFLEGGNNQLTVASALAKIQNLAIQEWTRVWRQQTEVCGEAPDNSTHNFYWTIPFKDSSEGFATAGLEYMTNLQINTAPCKLNSYRTRTVDEEVTFTMTFTSTTTTSSEDLLAEPTTQISAENVGANGFLQRQRKLGGDNSNGDLSAEDEGSPEKTVRDFFPETWLWEMVDIDGTGSAVVPSTAPDTITEWIGNAVCMNDRDGLGVSEPASLIAFQPFFVSMRLPYSVIRGEKLPVLVTANNYLSKCMAVQLSMNPSPDYTLDTNSQASQTACVCGQDTVTRSFTIIFSDIGNINVSITAEVIRNNNLCPAGSEMSQQVGMSDTVIRHVVVEPEGSPRDYTVSEFICMTRPDTNQVSGSAVAEFELPLPPVSDLVADSERAFVRVVGDVMGPALSNLDNLLRMPYGCAEQTMVSFAPNIFALKYLEAVNKDDPDTRSKAIQYMKAGYQRELTYAHNDQSYSSFGQSQPDTPGSMWLTAFVVKCFGLADPYIFIDQNIQTRSIAFFTKNQDRDGCFPQIGTVHSKYMQGGFGDTQNGTNKAALTAFVTIAMIEAGVKRTDPSIINAFRCIDAQTYQDAYTTSIVAYAYSLFDSRDARAASVYTRLMNMAKVNGSLTMWKANENEPAEPQLTWWWYRPRSADIETTAYALLTKLNMVSDTNMKISEGLPIVRWLSTQRNPWGGFGSTQDTVIGLQSLAEYAALIYSDGLQAAITVSEKTSNTQIATFSLNNVNSFVQFTERIPRVTDLVLRATGTGCFLAQTNVRYNINKQDRNRMPFRTTARVFRKRGSKDACKSRQMQICTQYLGEGGVSNMAIVEVKMVSGWAAQPESLKKLLTDQVAQLKRFEIDPNGAVQLYFEPLDRTQRCMTIDIQEEFEVKDAKPAVVTTYDYYKTELRHEVEYRIFRCTRNVSRDRRPIIFF